MGILGYRGEWGPQGRRGRQPGLQQLGEAGLCEVRALEAVVVVWRPGESQR